MKTDTLRRVVLTSVGTRSDLERLGIALEEGLLLKLYTDDADDDGRPDNIVIDGIAHYDEEARRWVATIDWNAIRSDPTMEDRHETASDAD
jgi:hypothetical protein